MKKKTRTMKRKQTSFVVLPPSVLLFLPAPRNSFFLTLIRIAASIIPQPTKFYVILFPINLFVTKEYIPLSLSLIFFSLLPRASFFIPLTPIFFIILILFFFTPEILFLLAYSPSLQFFITFP